MNNNNTATPSRAVRVGKKDITLYQVAGMETCDNCSLYFEDTKQGSGRVVLTAYQTSWTAYWSNLVDGETAESRFMRELSEDLVRSFQYGTPRIASSDRYKETGYLHHMIDQVRQHLRASGML